MHRQATQSHLGLVVAFVLVSLVSLGAVQLLPDPPASPDRERDAGAAAASIGAPPTPPVHPMVPGTKAPTSAGSRPALPAAAGEKHPAAVAGMPQSAPPVPARVMRPLHPGRRGWIRVVGRVESDDGAAVAGAAVDVPALDRGTLTDSHGRYELLLPPGTHVLRLARLDHRTLERRLTVPAGEATVARDWQLERRDLQLRPVVVHATRHRNEAALPAGQHVVLADDVQRRIGGFEDVMRVVQALPSVGSASDFHGEFFVRGAGTHANAIYLDGIPIFFPYHILGFNSVFNPGIVESAEFFAGGTPVAYGGGTGGVLLVRSRGAHPSDHRGDAGLSYVSAHLRAAGGDEHQGWELSLRRSYHDQVLRWVSADNSSQMPSFYDGMLRGRWQPSANHLLVGGVLVAGDGLSIPSPEASALRHDLIQTGDDTPGGIDASSDRLALDNKLTVGSLSWRAVLGPRAYLETVVGYVPQRLLFTLKGDNDESVDIESRTLALRQDLAWQRQAHRLHFGFEAYEARTEGLVSAYAAFLGLRQSNAALNVADQKERYTLDLGATRRFVALHGQDDWSLAHDAVQLGFGLRYEHDGLARQDLWSPRLALELRPGSSWNVRGTWGVSHALRSSPLDVQPTRSGAPLGAERAHEATLGVTRRGSMLHGGVSAYVKRFEHLVYEEEPAYYANGGSGRSHGVESWLEFAPRPTLALRAQYVWSQTQQRDPQAWRRLWHEDAGTGESVWGPVQEEPYWYRPLQDQRHRIALDGRLRHRAWEFGVHLQLASGLPYTPVVDVARDADGNAYGIVGRKGSAELPAYQRLDLRVLRHFDGKSVDWRVFAEVLNATSAANVYMQRWNRAYTQQNTVTMLPLLPTVGVEASF